MITKKNFYNFYFLFLFSHLFIWTLVPYIVNENLPLDTIEALAWGSDLDWGFNKHPPFSAFAVEVFYVIFGNQDWAYYLLSQIFIVSSFIFVFKLSKEFLNNDILAFFSVLLLEGIFFFNYTSPEFNVNISQLPFWALSVLFTWRGIKHEKFQDFLLLGIFIGFGILSKYIFLFLVVGIKLLFIYLVAIKKIKSYNFLVVGPTVLIVIFPHLVWLIDNNFVTLSYGIQRAEGFGGLIDHLYFPLSLMGKQMIVLIPFFLMIVFLIKKVKFKKINFNEKIIFLIFTCLLPIFLMILTSAIMGVKIRTMWMTPFYLFFGLLFMEIFQKYINLKKLNSFYFTFLIFFIISPLIYSAVSVSNEFKRTDYPGKEIARLVQEKWDKNFRNEIKIVVGDEWYAGNLSYHLPSRPKWTIEIKEKTKDLRDDQGVVYTGNPKILKKICPGVFGTIKPVGYCMIGKK